MPVARKGASKCRPYPATGLSKQIHEAGKEKGQADWPALLGRPI